MKKSKKRKILILANNDAGLYKFRKELIDELIQEGNEIFISLPDGEYIKALVSMGCVFCNTNVDRRGMNPLKDLKMILRYVQMVKKIKPSLVITYTIKPNIYGGIVSRFLKVSYAVNITGLGTAFQNDGLLKRLTVFLYKMACKEAKVVFFENEGNRQLFLQEKLIKEEQTCLLNGAGVNIEEYSYTEYPDKEKPTHFLFIGRVMKEKGVDELFEVAKSIKKEYPEVIFDIVGPFEENYESTISELMGAGVIEYHGFQKDVKPFIKQCHCLVLPSYHEGMANTLLEAGAMGRPLITSRIHGCMETVVEGESGFLCEKQDVADLYRSLRRFMQLNYEEKVECGKKSRKWIVDKFDKEFVVKKTAGRLQ